MIEDAPAGVAAANAAGMASVGLLSTGRTPADLAAAHAVVGSLGEISPQMLRDLISSTPLTCNTRHCHEKILRRKDHPLSHSGSHRGNLRRRRKTQRDDRGLGRHLLLRAAVRRRLAAKSHLFAREHRETPGVHRQRSLGASREGGRLFRHRLGQERRQVRRHRPDAGPQRPGRRPLRRRSFRWSSNVASPTRSSWDCTRNSSARFST